MSSNDPRRPPERLIHGRYGSLLRRASRQWEWGVDEAAAFRRVAERAAAARSDRARERKRWLILAPIGFATLAVAAVLARSAGSELAAPELVAEPWRPLLSLSAEPSSSVVASSTEQAAPRLAEPSSPPNTSRRGAGESASRASASLAPSPLPSADQAPPIAGKDPPVAASATAERATPPDCLSLAREGQSRAAEACFVERGRGSGLAAEMALHELARLRRDVLADPDGALRALADYRTRFPAGSLRREIEVSQLELLLQLGRSDDALKQSDELLSSSSAGERASELRLLRGHILRKQSRFAEAVREYELAEQGRARAAEALYFRAVCLEAIGRREDAAVAFSKYLEQPNRPYAQDAKRRLEKVKP